ncbi:hypothetical protein BH11PSE2_BH11PSE2_07130 [soil metagenome]
MDFLKDRRVVIAGGAAVVALLALIIALTVVGGDKGPKAPPPASEAGLVIDVGKGIEVKRNPNQEYRCFKDGQFVGMATLDDCAKRNGVLSGALDVGIDANGALAASPTLSADITPLPPGAALPPAVGPASAVLPAPAVASPAGSPVATPQAPPSRIAASTCQRYEHAWANLGEMTLNSCIQTLFAGRCERAGSASYGRWGDQTLRLVPGRVETSSDDRTFRTLADQGQNCAIPSL